MSFGKTGLIEKLRSILFIRQQSYRAVFDPTTVGGERVLADLAKFCRANESTFMPDDRAHAVLEGRREVWLRIQQHLNLTPEQLWKLYAKGNES